jgi:ABC-type glycerol-3-phosphate transport system substrate-binding protein
MHAIERPHLPRMASLALGAVLLAVVVLLLAASRVGDLGMSSTASSTPPAASTPATLHHAWRTSPSAFTNVFSSPFHAALPWASAPRR